MIDIYSNNKPIGKSDGAKLSIDEAINLVNYIKYVLNHVAGYILENKSSKRRYKIEELQALFNHFKQPTHD